MVNADEESGFKVDPVRGSRFIVTCRLKKKIYKKDRSKKEKKKEEAEEKEKEEEGMMKKANNNNKQQQQETQVHKWHTFTLITVPAHRSQHIVVGAMAIFWWARYHHRSPPSVPASSTTE